MSLTNPGLLALLVCPVCGGDLCDAGPRLACTGCSRGYEVRSGIPLLYPPSVDADHLRQEQDLARMMGRPRLGRKEQFDALQWRLAKQEFWGMVRQRIAPPPKTFVNLGCGTDPYFSEFEQQGYTFVNLDMVYEMLYTLQSEQGARSCVAADIGSLPLRKCSFDYVVCIDVVHHESDQASALLAAFRDLLKPGGLLFLRDPNAWGMFQWAKSVLLPRPVYRGLRSAYHRIRRSTHRPADYEFPTSVWRIKATLERLGYRSIRVLANDTYPCISEAAFRFWRLFGGIELVRKYCNYHYTLVAAAP